MVEANSANKEALTDAMRSYYTSGIGMIKQAYSLPDGSWDTSRFLGEFFGEDLLTEYHTTEQYLDRLARYQLIKELQFDLDALITVSQFDQISPTLGRPDFGSLPVRPQLLFNTPPGPYGITFALTEKSLENMRDYPYDLAKKVPPDSLCWQYMMPGAEALADAAHEFAQQPSKIFDAQELFGSCCQKLRDNFSYPDPTNPDQRLWDYQRFSEDLKCSLPVATAFAAILDRRIEFWESMLLSGLENTPAVDAEELNMLEKLWHTSPESASNPDPTSAPSSGTTTPKTLTLITQEVMQNILDRKSEEISPNSRIWSLSAEPWRQLIAGESLRQTNPEEYAKLVKNYCDAINTVRSEFKISANGFTEWDIDKAFEDLSGKSALSINSKINFKEYVLMLADTLEFLLQLETIKARYEKTLSDLPSGFDPSGEAPSGGTPTGGNPPGGSSLVDNALQVTATVGTSLGLNRTLHGVRSDKSL